MKCSYGCNNDARFILKNGKHICSKSPSQCLVNRSKGSLGLKQCYEENGRARDCFTDSGRQKSIETKRAKQLSEFLNHEKLYSNNAIKGLLIREKIFSYKCFNCGIDEWMGEPISLELDHINGDSFNNDVNNLRLLCPNCHSITNTFRGRNKNTGRVKVSDETLLEALQREPNIRQALISVKLSPKGGNYVRASKLMNQISTN